MKLGFRGIHLDFRRALLTESDDSVRRARLTKIYLSKNFMPKLKPN